MPEKTSTIKEIMERLQAPFDEADLEWKNDKGSELPYFHWTIYQKRMDEVFGFNWDHDFMRHGDGGDIECTIIAKLPDGQEVKRSNIGQDDTYVKKDTGEVVIVWGTGRAQAFKRACVGFGVGLYVYSIDKRRKGQQSAPQQPTASHSDARGGAGRSVADAKAPPPQKAAEAPARELTPKAMQDTINRLGEVCYGSVEWEGGVNAEVAKWASTGVTNSIALLSQPEGDKVLKSLNKKIEEAKA